MKLAALLLLAIPQLLTAQPIPFTAPACNAPNQQLAHRTAYLLCYDADLQQPAWTAYELLPTQLHADAPRPAHFRHDASLNLPSPYDTDYRNTGFSRGHLVPARDMAFSDSAIAETFLLTNAAPQRQSMNAGPWRRLENAVRRIAASADAVIVYTGPIFDTPHPDRIGRAQIAVPTHFYKVILAIQGETKTLYAAIVPNTSSTLPPLTAFVVSVDEVELHTHLDFFSDLNDAEEARLESTPQPLPAALTPRYPRSTTPAEPR